MKLLILNHAALTWSSILHNFHEKHSREGLHYCPFGELDQPNGILKNSVVFLFCQRLDVKLKELLQRQLAVHRSPFCPGKDKDGRPSTLRSFVLAFEVSWDNICGLDYTNTLVLDGRLIIEVHKMVKRVFNSVGLKVSYNKLLVFIPGPVKGL